MDRRLWREHRALLVLTTSHAAPPLDEIRRRIHEHGFKIANVALDYRGTERRLRLRLQWLSAHEQTGSPDLLDELYGLAGVEKLSWRPTDAELLAE